ncbi:MAG: hypothetical protein EOS63_03520 [Mesorhizobium sp.]|uniref:hypothetical protein n=1 Tax=Mesorhizobium sp. TaxID=1871066 RepID=UPI000FE5B9E5|nr:hypothetical protein [Mesorhizobium sp.]RWE84202.1 MAG: hypothetical protein EOS63_03520 [Mesorhizobium sp.]TJW64630.1 MAG: hypothetical protein E5V97_06435 [Mesorhizobium sp.]
MLAVENRMAIEIGNEKMAGEIDVEILAIGGPLGIGREAAYRSPKGRRVVTRIVQTIKEDTRKLMRVGEDWPVSPLRQPRSKIGDTDPGEA